MILDTNFKEFQDVLRQEIKKIQEQNNDTLSEKLKSLKDSLQKESKETKEKVDKIVKTQETVSTIGVQMNQNIDERKQQLFNLTKAMQDHEHAKKE